MRVSSPPFVPFEPLTIPPPLSSSSSRHAAVASSAARARSPKSTTIALRPDRCSRRRARSFPRFVVVAASSPPPNDSANPNDYDSPPGRYPDADPVSHRPSDADVETFDWSDSESDDIDANTRSTLARMDLAA